MIDESANSSTYSAWAPARGAMSADSVMPRAGRRRPSAIFIGVGLAMAAAALAAVMLATSGGGPPAKSATAAKTAAAGESAAVGPISTESTKLFRTAVVVRMRAEHLNYNWVSCVPSGRRFQRVRVVRCNVDFGIDPHVEAYCSVLSGGRLLTSADDPAIPCSPDKAGRVPKLITYG